MKNENKGSRKAPRKHDPKWKDSTITQRQQNRRAKLNQIAQAAGFESWSAFETACLNGMAQPTQVAADGLTPSAKSKGVAQPARR
jgi:hypothetical protein